MAAPISRVSALPRDTAALIDAVVCQGLGGLGGVVGGFAAAGALVDDSAAVTDKMAALNARQMRVN
jgi:hypothetical protein